jgi:hypothetical protein
MKDYIQYFVLAATTRKIRVVQKEKVVNLKSDKLSKVYSFSKMRIGYG